MIPRMLYTSSFCLFRILPTLALTLQPIQLISNSTPPASPINETVPGPASLSLDFPSVAKDFLVPTCNGGLFGFDMNKYSCLQAWQTIPKNQMEYTFGDGFDKDWDFDVKLPRRFSGPDGTCVIDILHKDGVAGDTTTFRQILRAAETVYGICISRGDQRAQGGYIRDIGQHKNLVVVLSVYEPTVSCFSRHFYIWNANESMQKLLGNIPVSTRRQKFGPEGESGVEVVLPATNSSLPIITPGGQRVKLTVDVEHRNGVTARWFDIWAGAVAVTSMCLARGYGGVATLPGGLTVTMDAALNSRLGNATAVS